jgi:hypothetical protein
MKRIQTYLQLLTMAFIICITGCKWCCSCTQDTKTKNSTQAPLQAEQNTQKSVETKIDEPAKSMETPTVQPKIILPKTQ